MVLKLERTIPPERGRVAIIAPVGEHRIDGEINNFSKLAEALKGALLKVDGVTDVDWLPDIMGSGGVFEKVFEMVCKAEIAVVDFSAGRTNVSLEYAIVRVLGKKVVVIARHEEDIPSDIRGHHVHVLYENNFPSTLEMHERVGAEITARLKEPINEATLRPLYSEVEEVATVKAVEQGEALVVGSSGRAAVLRDRDVTYREVVRDMRKRFRVGQELHGRFVFEPELGQHRYTLVRAGENPWLRLEREFPVGKAFTGRVVHVLDSGGVFVHVDGEINGFLPSSALIGAVPCVGDRIEVVIAAVDAVSRKVKLSVGDAQILSDAKRDAVRLPEVGVTFVGKAVSVKPKAPGGGPGYVLIALPDSDRAGMLHSNQMLEDLKADLEAGEVERGDLLWVEVVAVDPRNQRVTLRDLGEVPEEGAIQLATA